MEAKFKVGQKVKYHPYDKEFYQYSKANASILESHIVEGGIYYVLESDVMPNGWTAIENELSMVE